MGVPKEILGEHPGLSEWCILHAYRGSISHGMYVPNSDPLSIDDKDTMAICVPTEDHYIGLKQFGSRGTQEIKRDEWDIVIYEARKALSLLAQGNPNILSLLWVHEAHVEKVTPAGQMLRDRRQVFVGKHVYHSFVGYARAQLRKMEAFRFEGYMGAKRKAITEKFGFDTKNASHLIRLLRMGIEFLIEGDLHVFRQDSGELLAIKRGEWSLERVKEEAFRLFTCADEAYLHSPLPTGPNMDDVNRLCVDIITQAHGERLG